MFENPWEGLLYGLHDDDAYLVYFAMLRLMELGVTTESVREWAKNARGEGS